MLSLSCYTVNPYSERVDGAAEQYINEGKIMGTITSINDIQELPDIVGKMRLIDKAGEVQTFLHRTEKILKVARDSDTYLALNIINHSMTQLDPAPIEAIPYRNSLSLPCFGELCLNPSEDGLRALIDSLKTDINEIYKMADVPGMK